MHDLIRALAPHIVARTFHPDVEGPVKIWRSSDTRPCSRVFRGRMHRRPEAGVSRCIVGKVASRCWSSRYPGGRRLPARDFLLGNSLEGAFS